MGKQYLPGNESGPKSQADFIAAAGRGDLLECIRLLRQPGITVDGKADTTSDVSCIAARYRPEKRTLRFKEATAFTEACAYGHLDLAKWLVEQGADPRYKNPQGYRATHIAAFMMQEEVVDWLVHAYQLRLSERDGDGYNVIQAVDGGALYKGEAFTREYSRRLNSLDSDAEYIRMNFRSFVTAPERAVMQYLDDVEYNVREQGGVPESQKDLIRYVIRATGGTEGAYFRGKTLKQNYAHVPIIMEVIHELEQEEVQQKEKERQRKEEQRAAMEQVEAEFAAKQVDTGKQAAEPSPKEKGEIAKAGLVAEVSWDPPPKQTHDTKENDAGNSSKDSGEAAEAASAAPNPEDELMRFIKKFIGEYEKQEVLKQRKEQQRAAMEQVDAGKQAAEPSPKKKIINLKTGAVTVISWDAPPKQIPDTKENDAGNSPPASGEPAEAASAASGSASAAFNPIDKLDPFKLAIVDHVEVLERLPKEQAVTLLNQVCVAKKYTDTEILEAMKDVSLSEEAKSLLLLNLKTINDLSNAPAANFGLQTPERYSQGMIASKIRSTVLGTMDPAKAQQAVVQATQPEESPIEKAARLLGAVCGGKVQAEFTPIGLSGYGFCKFTSEHDFPDGISMLLMNVFSKSIHKRFVALDDNAKSAVAGKITVRGNNITIDSDSLGAFISQLEERVSNREAVPALWPGMLCNSNFEGMRIKVERPDVKKGDVFVLEKGKGYVQHRWSDREKGKKQAKREDNCRMM